MKILVTGGAGYIGSHTCVELLNADHEIVIVDNLSNSSEEAINRICELSEKDVDFYNVDVLDKDALEAVFANHKFEAVIHFAALKAVGESVQKPLLYYHNNITGSITLCEVMKKYDVKNIVFSSSATVYGDPASVPIREDFPVFTTNPYGTTKLVMESILRDVYAADNSWNIAILRYFNPVGAHKSGRIGEDPNGLPNNLMPYVSQVAVGKLKELQIFGDDYPTKDGTGVRDYIHVVDLAKGHLAALNKLATKPGEVTYNLGTGKGYIVIEMVKAFEKASGKPVPYKIVERRAGDIAECWADPKKAKDELGWEAELGLEDMCNDGWRWQSQNPEGYEK
jgi:UDP-glucose 4-epimerase